MALLPPALRAGKEGIVPRSAITFVYAALAGLALATGLELAVRALWGHYGQFPMPGYEGAAAAGLIDPALYSSTRALLQAMLAYAIAGVVLGLLPPRPGRGVVFGIAALLAHSAFAFAYPRVREGNMAPLTPLFLAIYFWPPLLLGLGLGRAPAGWRARGGR